MICKILSITPKYYLRWHYQTVICLLPNGELITFCSKILLLTLEHVGKIVNIETKEARYVVAVKHANYEFIYLVNHCSGMEILKFRRESL